MYNTKKYKFLQNDLPQQLLQVTFPGFDITCNVANKLPLNHLLLCFIRPSKDNGGSVKHFAPGT